MISGLSRIDKSYNLADEYKLGIGVGALNNGLITCQNRIVRNRNYQCIKTRCVYVCVRMRVYV